MSISPNTWYRTHSSHVKVIGLEPLPGGARKLPCLATTGKRVFEAPQHLEPCTPAEASLAEMLLGEATKGAATDGNSTAA